MLMKRVEHHRVNLVLDRGEDVWRSMSLHEPGGVSHDFHCH